MNVNLDYFKYLFLQSLLFGLVFHSIYLRLCVLSFAFSFAVVFGSLHYLPCRRTVDIDTKVLQCLSHHTIYIVNHVVEDGTQRLSESDVSFGCPVQHALCAWSYPTNHLLPALPDSIFLEYAVINCNWKNSCYLKKQYFENAENFFWRNCEKLEDHRSLKVRQSVAYECVSGILKL
jgi:hypothetical protein